MLSWFRVHARPFALAALVSLAALGSVAEAAHASNCHDAECVVFEHHDASSHRVTSGQTDSAHPLHCLACHWTRSTRPAAVPVHHLERPIAQSACLPVEVLCVPSIFPAAQPPLRAPPATPTRG